MTLLFLFGFVACTTRPIKPTPEEAQLLEQFSSKMGPEYSAYRLVSGQLTLTVNDIQTLHSDDLRESNLKSGIPDSTAPSLRIWISGIMDYSTQRMIEHSPIQYKPDSIFLDREYGNQILYWDLTPALDSDSIRISRSFRYLTYDYRPVVDGKLERNQWSKIPSEIVEKYTRPELFLEQDEALVDTVFALLKDISDPVNQAQAIYDWVQKSLTYVYPPEARGVRNALNTLEGDCGQYSALFISMARIAGIPARQQSGFNFRPGNTGAHVWSEVYLPVKGWVPVDATRKDGFLHLDNGRLITSIGLNIPLVNVPEWASFTNSEVENDKTDFMQMFTLVSSGVKATYTSKRTVLRSVDFK